MVTHEIFEHLHNPEILTHLIDSGISDAHLQDVASGAVHDVAPEFHFIPWVGFGIIAYQSWRRYQAGAPLNAVLRTAFRRGSYSTACRGMDYFTTFLAHEPFAGAVSSIVLRLGLGRYDAQKQFVEFVGAQRSSISGKGIA